jgi:diamine N-acetyltransferase
MVTIRPGSRADLAGIVALETAADTAMWLGETGLTWHERALVDPDQELLVAEDRGTLAGFAVLVGVGGSGSGSGAGASSDGGRDIELRRMAVDPAMRGAGLGRWLLREVVARARDEHAAHRVLLDVKKHNHRAIALYESEGFTPVPGPPTTMTEPDGGTSELITMALRVAGGA